MFRYLEGGLQERRGSQRRGNREREIRNRTFNAIVPVVKCLGLRAVDLSPVVEATEKPVEQRFRVEVLSWESRWAQCSERLVDGWGADAATSKSTAIANAEAKDKRLQAALEEFENALSSSDEGEERSNNSGGEELPLLQCRC